MAFKSREPIIGIYRCLARVLIALIALLAAASALNPVPLINQPLVPDATKPGGAGFTLTVNGTGFVSGSLVNWNGSARATTFVSTSKLTASIVTSDIATAKTASVTVVNPGPGGGASNIAFFAITTSTSFVSLKETDLSSACCPSSVVAADFNHSGNYGLALATNGASVFLGNGDGTFQSETDYPAGANPYDIVVGDFNGDGNIDLAVSNFTTAGSVSILLNNGTGGFLAPVGFPTGASPIGLATGDFNRDGKLDIVVANSGSNSVSVLLGNGDGSFQAAVEYAVSTTPYAVVVGDFNGDGKLDLAVANGGTNTISVLLGNGDGKFQRAVEYAVGNQPHSLAVGDFNGDGKLDLAVANSASNYVSVLLGHGDGTFAAATNYPAGSAGPASLAVGDVNGDGYPDLVVVNGSSVLVFFGNRNGTFQPAVAFSGYASPYPEIALADFNKGGRLDVAIPGSGGTTFSVQLQTPVFSLSTTSLTFADQLTGTTSTAQTAKLSNLSGIALTVSIAVTGTNPGDFSQTNNCGSSVPPLGSCTIAVRFAPTQIGPRAAAVTITDSAPGSPQSIALSGTGVVSGADATLSTASLTFVNQVLGTTSAPQTVMLSDYGTAALNISSLNLTGVDPGDFGQTNTCGSSVAPGATCKINVTFKPTQLNARTAALSNSDNAPNSPQVVNLSGTGTVVSLVPSSLNFGKVYVKNHSTRSVTLTNTAHTSLSITSLTITGTNAGDYKQTNTCGSSVAAGKSCTISVTFTPSTLGTRSASISISDNGGGSPQQVPMTGFGYTHGVTASEIGPAMFDSMAVPNPTGQDSVGTRTIRLVDSSRVDPFIANGSKRELLVRLWYPAADTLDFSAAEYASPTVWSYFGQLVGYPLPAIATNSYQDAPIANGIHPVVVFTPGYTGTFTDYTFLFEDLASRGYIVASIDHTYEATAVEFPDGRLVKSMFGSHLKPDTLQGDDRSLSFAFSVRQRDLSFVMAELRRLNADASTPLSGKLDLTRVVLAGHSMGGVAALVGMQRDTGFRAAVVIDGVVPDAEVEAPTKPVLLLTMGRDQWSANDCRVWNKLAGDRVLVNLTGAEHVTPTDLVWLAKGAVKTGPMGPEKTIAAVRNYIAAFLDANLRSKPADRLLTGPSPEYPDAVVTTQSEPLCRP